MFFADALTLDAPKRTAGGYLAVRARAAKTGVYQYTGREVDPDNANGLRDAAIVNVLRDEATVFDQAAVRTFIGKPVTDDHPSVEVNATNWRDHGRGVIMGALRDGDHLAFDLLLMDGPTIAKVEAGKRELSNGYKASLEFGDFTAPDGTKCQARQARISDGNHVALVDRARGGETCRIGDVATCDALSSNLLDNLTTEKPKMKITIGDAKDVDLSDGAAVALAVGALNTSLADAQATVIARDATLVDRDATIVARDAEIARLTAELADANDPAKRAARDAELRDAAGKATALGVTVGDAATLPDIHKALVDAKMGDKAKDYDATAYAIAFDALTKDAKVEQVPANDAFKGLRNLGDAAAQEQAAFDAANDFNAWRTAGAGN